MKTAIRASLCCVLLQILPLPTVLAQGGDRDLPPPSGLSAIPFRFGPPGARSLGMGGAFIALADDATASEANPAGLTLLFRPEVSIHGRSTSTDLEVFDLNSAAALDNLNAFRTDFLDLPPLEGGDRMGNAFADSPQTTLSDSASEASFASFVKPFEGYTVSIYFQRSADFEASSEFQAYDDGFLDVYRTRQRIGLAFESFGVSAAFKAGDFVSVGFSLRHSTLDLDTFQELRVDYFNDLESQFDDPNLNLAPGAPREDLLALPIIDFFLDRLRIEDSDSDITFNVGILLNPKPNAKWSAGLVYKNGGDYEVSGLSETIDCLSTNGLVDFDFFEPGVQGAFCNPETLTGDGAVVTSVPLGVQNVKIPDFFGIGVAWRITDRLKLALDANAITYSDLDLGLLDDPATPPPIRSRLEAIDDEIELHFGVEYTSFLGGNKLPLILRGGLYTDPDHDGFRQIDSDQTVYTFGLGTVLRQNLQIDVAGQFSGPADSGVLSLVYRF